MSQRDGVARGHEFAGFAAENLGNAADIRGDDRLAAGERLQDHIRAAFHVTRQGNQIGCRHPDGHLVEGASGQGVDIGGGVTCLDGALEPRPVRPPADHVDTQIGALRMQQSRRFDQFTKAFPHVHASDIDDCFGGRVDAEPAPRRKTVAGMED